MLIFSISLPSRLIKLRPEILVSFYPKDPRPSRDLALFVGDLDQLDLIWITDHTAVVVLNGIDKTEEQIFEGLAADLAVVQS